MWFTCTFSSHAGETASPCSARTNTPFDNQMLAVLWPPWRNNESYTHTLSTHCESTVLELKESWIDLVLGKILVRMGSLVNNGQGGLRSASELPIKSAPNHDRLSYKLEHDGVKISGGAHYAAHYARCALSFKSHSTRCLNTNKYANTIRVWCKPFVCNSDH